MSDIQRESVYIDPGGLAHLFHNEFFYASLRLRNDSHIYHPGLAHLVFNTYAGRKRTSETVIQRYVTQMTTNYWKLGQVYQEISQNQSEAWRLSRKLQIEMGNEDIVRCQRPSSEWWAAKYHLSQNNDLLRRSVSFFYIKGPWRIWSRHTPPATPKLKTKGKKEEKKKMRRKKTRKKFS